MDHPWSRLNTLGRPALVGLVVLFAIAVGRGPAKAEFEVPYIDATSTQAKVEFRGAWSINRASNANGYGGYYGLVEGYEAYAVGIDPSITSADKTDKNGVVFFYDGGKWSQVSSPAQVLLPSISVVPLYEVNAVAGQYNGGYGTPSPLLVAGSKGRISATLDYHAKLTDNDIGRRFSEISWVNRNATEDRPFYAIDAGQSYLYTILAGGKTNGTAPIVAIGTTGSMTVLSPTDSNPARQVTGLVDPARENIVGIRFVDLDTAYIATTTFEGNADRYDQNGRTCANSGAQVGRLYRARRAAGGFKNWLLLGSKTGVCFYGLAAGKKTEPTTTGLSNLPSVIWLASSNGVYAFDEETNTVGTTNLPGPRPGTDGQMLYSISAVADRGGQNQDLLTNGKFSYWADTSTPDNWVHTDNPWGFNGGATCGTNDNDFSQYSRSASNKAAMVWPAKPYNNPTCTGTYAGPQTSSLIARIDTAPFQGQTITISGRYHVEFTPRTSPGDTMPSHAEGGVSIGCSGGKAQPGAAFPINCSMRTRRFIHTYSAASANNGVAVNNPTPGVLPNSSLGFSVTLSRQDYETGQWYTGSPGNGILITPRRFDLEIRCEATYGAKVWCDDLKVTEVTDPPTPPRNEFYVVATGRNRTVLSNPRGLTSSASFSAETQSQFLDAAARRFDYQAVYGSALQHVYVAGVGLDTTVPASPTVIGEGSSTLLSRAPSTLVGYVWVGTADAAGTTPAGTGIISTSCINNKVNGQTLCQRSADSYGLQFDVPRVVDGSGDIGSLGGRAWFGKQLGSGETNDAEQTAAGECFNNESVVNVPAGRNTYDITGVCNTIAHRCKIDRNSGTTTLSSRSCYSDYDCYGRCETDYGRICVSNDDCSITGSSNLNGSVYTPNILLQKTPANYLQCSIDNPQACAGFGWLSFESDDFAASEIIPPNSPTEAWGVNYNSLSRNHNQSNAADAAGGHELSGWARFKTLSTAAGLCTYANISCKNDLDCFAGGTNFGPCQFSASHASGWVHFRSNASATPTPKTLNVQGTGNVDYMVACQDCYGNGLGNMNCAFCATPNRASCRPSSTAATARCTYFCDNAAPGTYKECTSDGDCGSGGHCKALGVCTGDNATVCDQDSQCASVGGTCSFGAFCRTAGASCAAYGVNVSLQTGAYYGYAWSEDFGWLDFRGVGRASARFIQTRLGSIYAGGTVGDTSLTQPQGINNCNATFLIRAGGDIASNWCSALGDTAKQPFSGSFTLPSSANQFTNALGRIDLTGVTTVNPAGSGKNKYSSPIVNLTLNAGNDIAHDLKAQMGSDRVLGGKVYKVSGCPGNVCQINEAVVLANGNLGDANMGNGAGILYVEGDLIINQPITYDTTTPATDPREIASLTVIVTGSMQIGTSIRDVVGAYYVMGNNGISTITTQAGAETNQLTVRGLMIAKQFTFGRRFAGTVENPAPSELIIYDGRLQTNPMPGLVDFSKILPAQISQP